MSTSYYLKTPLLIHTIEEKTDIRINYEAELLELDNGAIAAFITKDRTKVFHLKRYGDMKITKILQELISKIDAEVISEYVMSEFIESESKIPDSVWQEYTASIIAAIQKNE